MFLLHVCSLKWGAIDEYKLFQMLLFLVFKVRAVTFSDVFFVFSLQAAETGSGKTGVSFCCKCRVIC